MITRLFAMIRRVSAASPLRTRLPSPFATGTTPLVRVPAKWDDADPQSEVPRRAGLHWRNLGLFQMLNFGDVLGLGRLIFVEISLIFVEKRPLRLVAFEGTAAAN